MGGFFHRSMFFLFFFFVAIQHYILLSLVIPPFSLLFMVFTLLPFHLPYQLDGPRIQKILLICPPHELQSPETKTWKNKEKQIQPHPKKKRTEKLEQENRKWRENLCISKSVGEIIDFLLSLQLGMKRCETEVPSIASRQQYNNKCHRNWSSRISRFSGLLTLSSVLPQAMLFRLRCCYGK